jgi:hypothetical protein
MKSLGLNPQQACIHHLDGNSKDYVDISQPELDKAGEEMNGAISKIINGNFSPKPSKSCSDCDWQRICSKKHLEAVPVETEPVHAEIETRVEYKPKPVFKERKSPIAPAERQRAFANFVAELKMKGITGEEFRNKRDQWLKEHKD